MSDDRLIVALDVHSLADMKSLVASIGDSVSYYKVGMELFYSVGAKAVEYLKSEGKKVFLDLKLHDIPNTVGEGLCSLMALGADMLNIHSSGGPSMMEKSVDKLRETAMKQGVTCPKVIAVTVLTSIGEQDWQAMGMNCSIGEQVARLAKLSKEAGLDGVVASPHEASMIRQVCGTDFIVVTPGIRPAESGKDDQSRIASPAEAIRNGASHIVVGRPIRAAKDPKMAAEAIVAEIKGVV